MLGQVIDWLLGRTEPLAARAPEDAVGDLELSPEAGLEILLGSPERRNFVQQIRLSLSTFASSQNDDLVDRVLSHLAYFLFDLPDPDEETGGASRRYGLLDRVLRAASIAVQCVSSPDFELSSDPAAEPPDGGPRWAYLGLIGAVALGLGKAFQVDVVLPGGAARWDARREALRLFCERHGIEATGPEHWTIRPAGGSVIPKPARAVLLGAVLTPKAGSFVKSRLPKLMRQLRAEERCLEPVFEDQPAFRVARIVRDRFQRSRGPEGACPSLQGSCAAANAPEGALLPRGASPDGEPLDAPDPDAEIPPESEASSEPTGDPDGAAPPGSSVGMNRRVAHALQPERFLETLRRMILANRFPKNERYGELFVRPDCVWLVLPDALERLRRIGRLPRGADILGLLERSLRGIPLVEPADQKQLCHTVRANPGWTPVRAVRIRTAGLLSESALRQIDLFPSGIEIVPAAPDARWGRR